MSGRRWVLSWLAVPLASALVAYGCAGGTETADDDDDGSGGSTSGTGGAVVGGGGTGGTTSTTTSTSLCDVDCSAIQTPACQVSECNEGQHRGTVGTCVVVPDEDGTPCDDGQFCTVDDACEAGICVGGPENDCGMTPSQCMELYCDENSQTCGEQAAAPGAPCQDPNDLCIQGATCNNGLCTGGTAEDCFFFPVPDDCHVAQCNPQTGQCEPVVGNEGGACTDPNDLCTVNKTCAAGVCQGGNPMDCSQLTQGCVLGVCDVNSGQCTTQNLNNGDPCDDLDPCTSGELCNNGSCTGGAPVTQCQNGDSCCPSNCTVQNDQDCAIVELDIGPFGSNFTGTSMTRGYWFQAPTNFTIKGLRVPTDVGTQPQNVQVVRFNSGAPSGGSNTNFTTLHYSSNVPGNNWIPMNIPVQNGQFIGILGARGTSTMNNSYGTNWFYNTTILSYPVTLTRLYYQGNLYSAAATSLGTEQAASYSRVEMQYGP